MREVCGSVCESGSATGGSIYERESGCHISSEIVTDGSGTHLCSTSAKLSDMVTADTLTTKGSLLLANAAYASNAGVRIHYEVEGSGKPLVLQHGFTDSRESWQQLGYVAALRDHYHVILIDARGHGESDKPHETADYTLDRRVTDVTAVLDALGIETASFWGYSMGGWIGFGLAMQCPRRVDRLVVGGQHPFARDQSGFRQWLRTGVAEGSDALVAAFKNMAGPISDAYAARLRAGDLGAWLAAAADREGIEDGLETMTMPCCIYAGDADPMFAQTKAASARIPHARFFPLPGLSHVQAMARSDLVLPHVMAFLNAPD
jgi:pimeloyl-ACP methyl ester carboxylesterase